MKARRRLFFGALACAIALIANSWVLPHIVFSTGSSIPGLAIALLMPLAMAAVGAPFPDRRLRLVAGAALWLMAAIGLAGATMIVLLVNTDINTMPRIVSTGRYTLATITVDYGATDEGRTEVAQVCRIVPGVMLARSLEREAGLELPYINVVGPDRVLIDGKTFDLQPLVWPLC